jgi:hypothetical protein
MFHNFPGGIGSVSTVAGMGGGGRHGVRGADLRVPAARAILGVLVVGGMLIGCADKGTPSEASIDGVTAHTHQAAAAVPPGHLRTIAVLDDCLPGDPGWAPIGGCVLADGRVSEAEFVAALPRGTPRGKMSPHTPK